MADQTLEETLEDRMNALERTVAANTAELADLRRRNHCLELALAGAAALMQSVGDAGCVEQLTSWEWPPS